MSTREWPWNVVGTDTGRLASTETHEASNKEGHTAKRKLDETEDREAHEESNLIGAKRHGFEQYDMQSSAQLHQRGASNQQKNDTKGQEVDKMDIDSNKKEGELDPKL